MGVWDKNVGVDKGVEVCDKGVGVGDKDVEEGI